MSARSAATSRHTGDASDPPTTAVAGLAYGVRRSSPSAGSSGAKSLAARRADVDADAGARLSSSSVASPAFASRPTTSGGRGIGETPSSPAGPAPRPRLRFSSRRGSGRGSNTPQSNSRMNHSATSGSAAARANSCAWSPAPTPSFAAAGHVFVASVSGWSVPIPASTRVSRTPTSSRRRGRTETEQRGAEVTRANCDDRVVFSRRHDGERDGAEVESSRAVHPPRIIRRPRLLSTFRRRPRRLPTEELRGFVRDLRI